MAKKATVVAKPSVATTYSNNAAGRAAKGGTPVAVGGNRDKFDKDAAGAKSSARHESYAGSGEYSYGAKSGKGDRNRRGGGRYKDQKGL